MRRLALALAAATFILAATTAYLAHTLKVERARPAYASVAPPAPSDDTAEVAHSGASVAVPAPAPAPTATSPPQPPQLPSNPALDVTRVAEIKAAFAPMMKDMMVYAGLNAYESERLLDLTSEAMARGQELSAECKSTPGCDIRTMQKLAQETLKRELDRILGAEKMQRLNTYDELQRVKSFRSQLPAGQELSEATATRLGTALAEERNRSVDKTESATTFNQRMYDRATGILTAGQLALFKKRQESTFGRD